MVGDNEKVKSRRHGMSIKIFLSSTLRKYVASYDPLTGFATTVEGPISVNALCDILRIPTESVKIAMVNGRKVKMDHVVDQDDRIALFPPVGGG
jgi:sulfur carrier protein ThiS